MMLILNTILGEGYNKILYLICKLMFQLCFHIKLIRFQFISNVGKAGVEFLLGEHRHYDLHLLFMYRPTHGWRLAAGPGISWSDCIWEFPFNEVHVDGPLILGLDFPPWSTFKIFFDEIICCSGDIYFSLITT